MKNKKKLPAIIQLAILTTITVVLWIIFDVYRALTVKPAPSVPAEITAPLNPELDQDSLGKLQESIYLEEEQIGDTAISSSQPVAAEIKTATEESEINIATEESEISVATEEGATNE